MWKVSTSICTHQHFVAKKFQKLKNKCNARIIKAQINLLATIGKKHLGAIRHENPFKQKFNISG